MKLSTINQVSALERRRNHLMTLRQNMELVARIRSGTGIGAVTENLSEQVVEQLKPIVDADLVRQIADVEEMMRDLGVTVD